MAASAAVAALRAPDTSNVTTAFTAGLMVAMRDRQASSSSTGEIARAASRRRSSTALESQSPDNANPLSNYENNFSISESEGDAPIIVKAGHFVPKCWRCCPTGRQMDPSRDVLAEKIRRIGQQYFHRRGRIAA
ncbi:spore germination cell wall hydrolase CwlJ-like protein [Bradyrhizobium diazoefficiens]